MSYTGHICRNDSTAQFILLGISTQQETTMKRTILVATCVAALSTFTALAASAQTTGPAAQDNSMKKDSMEKGGMKKDNMETKGMANDSMKKDSMNKKEMSKDGSPSADTMKKDGMSK
jgi:pentapeptide MXKDX repeat protein